MKKPTHHLTKIPFSPPYIDEEVEAEVLDCLRSGWITTGPKVNALEAAVEQFTGCTACICVNSWTSGAILALRWFGIGPGDEVIVPAYTYSATALAVLHCGATPVMVDVGHDFNLPPESLAAAITERTKAVIPVDIGGWPAEYTAIREVLLAKQGIFVPANPIQRQLGRMLLLSDAAHSFGAVYQGRPFNTPADIVVYSFHAVKNLTTAEGGAICLNLPDPFHNELLKPAFKRRALNGQSKDALAKTQIGAWRYDILEAGFKFNMPDLCAAIGLAQIKQYEHLLRERRRVFEGYKAFFSSCPWAVMPPEKDENRQSSWHLFMLRIRGINEGRRDAIVGAISASGVSVNVHFIPMPMMTLFRTLGYRIEEYPNAYAQYAGEITLPVYPQLSDDQVVQICRSVAEAVENIGVV